MNQKKISRKGDKGSVSHGEGAFQTNRKVQSNGHLDNALLEQVLLSSQEAAKAVEQAHQQFAQFPKAPKTERKLRAYYLQDPSSAHLQKQHKKLNNKLLSPRLADYGRQGEPMPEMPLQILDGNDSVVPVRTEIVELEGNNYLPEVPGALKKQKSGAAEYLQRVAKTGSQKRYKVPQHGLILTEPQSPRGLPQVESDAVTFREKTTPRGFAQAQNGKKRAISLDFVNAFGEKEAENERLRALNDALKTQVERLMKENAALRSQASQRESAVDVAVLYAQPRYLNGELVDDLGAKNETKAIKKAIKSTGQHVKYKKVQSTPMNFRETIFQQPKVLHLSLRSYHKKDGDSKQQNYLLLEKPEGGPQLCRWEQLIKGLESELTSIMVAVITSEASEQLAQIFASKIRHVVFCKARQKVSKATTAAFLEHLYALLLTGQTVCRAFDRARESAARQTADPLARRFELLRNDQHTRAECVNYFWPRRQGQFESVSDRVRFKASNAEKPDHVFQRADDAFGPIYKELISEQNRLMCIKGYRGVGKSDQVADLLAYANTRKIFTGGVMHLSLQGVASKYSLVASLRDTVLKLLDMKASLEQTVRDRCRSDESTLDFIAKFLSKGLSEEFKDLRPSLQAKGKDQRMLLVLDEVTEMMDYAKPGFKKVILSLQQACPSLKVLVVLRDTLFYNANELMYTNLQAKDPVALFFHCLRKQGQIASSPDMIHEETISLIEGTRKEHFFRDIAPVIKQGGVRAFLQGSNSEQACFGLLCEHPLFAQLVGNPAALNRLATCFTQNRVSGNLYQSEEDTSNTTLLQLYHLMKRILSELYERKKVPNCENDQNKADKAGFAIKVTTMMLFELFGRGSMRNLLHFYSFLPGGIRKEHLMRVWSQKTARVDLAELEKLKLVSVKEVQVGVSLFNRGAAEGQVGQVATTDFSLREFTFKETTAESKHRYLRFIVDFLTDRLKQGHAEMLRQPQTRFRKISKLDEKLSIIQKGNNSEGQKADKPVKESQNDCFIDLGEMLNLQFIFDRVLEQLDESEPNHNDDKDSGGDRPDSSDTESSENEQNQVLPKPEEIDLKDATQLNPKPVRIARKSTKKWSAKKPRRVYSLDQDGLMDAYPQGPHADDQKRESRYEETFSFYKSEMTQQMSQYQAFVVYAIVNLVQVEELTLAYSFAQRALQACLSTPERLTYFERNLMRLITAIAEKVYRNHTDSVKESPVAERDLKRRVEKLASFARRLEGELGYLPHRELGIELFQLGLLYKAYPALLASSPKIALQKAELCLRRAYQQFQAIEHFRGMYLAKKHEASLLSDPEYDRLSKLRDQGTQTFHAGPVGHEPPMTPSLRSRTQLAQEASQQAKHAKARYLAGSKASSVGPDDCLLLQVVEAEREDLRRPQQYPHSHRSQPNTLQNDQSQSQANIDPAMALQQQQLRDLHNFSAPLMTPMMVQPVDSGQRQVKFVNKLYSEVDETGKLHLRFDNRWFKAQSIMSSHPGSQVQSSPLFTPMSQSLASPQIRFQAMSRQGSLKRERMGSIATTVGKRTFQASPNTMPISAITEEKQLEAYNFSTEANAIELIPPQTMSPQTHRSIQSQQLAQKVNKSETDLGLEQKDKKRSRRESIKNKTLKLRPYIMNENDEKEDLTQTERATATFKNPQVSPIRSQKD